MRQTVTLILGIAIAAFAPIKANADSLCMFTNSPNGPIGAHATPYARNVLNQIQSAVGIQFNAVPIYQGNVGNAAAFRSPQGSFIVYDPQFMNQLLAVDEAASASVLAHELGHLIGNQQGHHNSHVRELQADRISGCIMRRLNIPQHRAIRVQQLLPSAGSQSHPASNTRMQHIILGHNNPQNCQ